MLLEPGVLIAFKCFGSALFQVVLYVWKVEYFMAGSW